MPKSVILIHAQANAPAKPAEGETCNGCGLCCLAEPCPAGMLVSRRSSGTCKALRWDDESSRYRCGLVTAPADVLGLGHGLAGRALGRLVSRLVLRWISAGSGCDASFGVVGNVAAPTTMYASELAGFGAACERGAPAHVPLAASSPSASAPGSSPGAKRGRPRQPATN